MKDRSFPYQRTSAKIVHGGGSTFDVVSRLQSHVTPVPKIPGKESWSHTLEDSPQHAKSTQFCIPESPLSFIKPSVCTTLKHLPAFSREEKTFV